MDRPCLIMLPDVRQLTDKEIKIIQTFALLLVDWSNDTLLKASLDRVMWGYAMYLLKDGDVVVGEHNKDLYWIKQLRDIFNAA